MISPHSSPVIPCFLSFLLWFRPCAGLSHCARAQNAQEPESLAFSTDLGSVVIVTREEIESTFEIPNFCTITALTRVGKGFLAADRRGRCTLFELVKVIPLWSISRCLSGQLFLFLNGHIGVVVVLNSKDLTLCVVSRERGLPAAVARAAATPSVNS
jgi:hypothetical protein